MACLAKAARLCELFYYVAIWQNIFVVHGGELAPAAALCDRRKLCPRDLLGPDRVICQANGIVDVIEQD